MQQYYCRKLRLIKQYIKVYVTGTVMNIIKYYSCFWIIHVTDRRCIFNYLNVIRLRTTFPEIPRKFWTLITIAMAFIVHLITAHLKFISRNNIIQNLSEKNRIRSNYIPACWLSRFLFIFSVSFFADPSLNIIQRIVLFRLRYSIYLNIRLNVESAQQQYYTFVGYTTRI